MAELNIGDHCCEPTCKQLDFLPIKCKKCDLIFCKDHSHPDAHACTCTNKVETLKEYTGPKGFTCELTGCKNRELAEILCPFCQKCFCLQHRHGDDHLCDNLPDCEKKMAKTTQHVQQILHKTHSASFDRKPTKKPVSKKAKATAAKVSLMKMKMKAVGNSGIPETERVYLLVHLPKGFRLKSKVMFFSKVWSIGRIIDLIAVEVELKNENDIIGAKKLRLFDRSEGQLLETDKSLEFYLTQETFFSGGEIVVEYVEDGLLSLEDYSDYKS